MSDVEKIIDSLLDQAQDKDCLANGDESSIFTEDAKYLRAAADLLKAQEPQTARLLTADEVQRLPDRTTVCVEQLISSEAEERGYVTGLGWGVVCNKNNERNAGLLVSLLGSFFPDTITKIPYEALYSREDGKGHYTVQFRFWTDRPTDEQSKAVKWE